MIHQFQFNFMHIALNNIHFHKAAVQKSGSKFRSLIRLQTRRQGGFSCVVSKKSKASRYTWDIPECEHCPAKTNGPSHEGVSMIYLYLFIIYTKHLIYQKNSISLFVTVAWPQSSSLKSYPRQVQNYADKNLLFKSVHDVCRFWPLFCFHYE